MSITRKGLDETRDLLKELSKDVSQHYIGADSYSVRLGSKAYEKSFGYYGTIILKYLNSKISIDSDKELIKIKSNELQFNTDLEHINLDVKSVVRDLNCQLNSDIEVPIISDVLLNLIDDYMYRNITFTD